MFKANEVSLKNVMTVAVLMLAVAVGFYLSRQQVKVSRSAPIFLGEEVMVSQPSKTIPAVFPVAKPASVSQAKSTAVKAMPAPVPTMAVPLPILPPSILSKVLPVYPQTALARGIEGIIVLSALIDLAGQPGNIQVKTSSGDRALDDAAVKAVSQWRFSPAAQGGTALASVFEVPVKFEIK